MSTVVDADVRTRIRDIDTAPEDFGERVRQTVWQQYTDNRSRLPLDTLTLSHQDEDHLPAVNAIVKGWQPSTHAWTRLAEIRNRWVHSALDESFGFFAELDELRGASSRLIECLAKACTESLVSVLTRATNPTSTPVSFLRVAHHSIGPRETPGVLAIDHQRQVIFTQDVELRFDSLPRRPPRMVSYRRTGEDDE